MDKKAFLRSHKYDKMKFILLHTSITNQLAIIRNIVSNSRTCKYT